MKRVERCKSCGYSNWVDTTDNFRQPYKGCANCRILPLDDIERLARGAK